MTDDDIIRMLKYCKNEIGFTDDELEFHFDITDGYTEEQIEQLQILVNAHQSMLKEVSG